MGKTGCKIICGALTTLAVKGLMMMMMMMMALKCSLGNRGYHDFRGVNAFNSEKKTHTKIKELILIRQRTGCQFLSESANITETNNLPSAGWILQATRDVRTRQTKCLILEAFKRGFP